MSNQRVVTIFSSKGKKQKIETDVTTWGALKPLVEEHFNLDNLQATENINKTTLENSQALLPATNFVLFLRAIKTKSGVDYSAMSFTDLRACLNDADKEELARTTGKNWTRVKRADIESLLNNKDSNFASNVKEVETVVEEIPPMNTINGVPATTKKKIKEIKSLIKSLKKEGSEEAKIICSDILESLKDLKNEFRELSEEELEDARLAKELGELNKGF